MFLDVNSEIFEPCIMRIFGLACNGNFLFFDFLCARQVYRWIFQAAGGFVGKLRQTTNSGKEITAAQRLNYELENMFGAVMTIAIVIQI